MWARAEQLGLDVARFDELRRNERIGARVRADFLDGIRAGVTGTPSAFYGAEPVSGDVAARLEGLAGGAAASA